MAWSLLNSNKISALGFMYLIIKFLSQANTEVALTNRSTNDQDTQTSQAQIEARRADLYSAKINVESAREDVNRYQGLDAIGAVSKAEVAHIKAQLAQAQAGADDLYAISLEEMAS